MSIFNGKPDYVVDRTDGNRYLNRWYLIPKNPHGSLYLHQIIGDDDDRALHNHRGLNVSFVLWGRYREHFADGSSRVRGPGSIVVRRAQTFHRLELMDAARPVWTLFFTGRWTQMWGFDCPNGFVTAPEFIAQDGCGDDGREGRVEPLGYRGRTETFSFQSGKSGLQNMPKPILDEDEARETVNRFREAFPGTVKEWDDDATRMLK
jgi:hypothetical protein